MEFKKLYAVIITYKPDERLLTIVKRLRTQSFAPEKIFIFHTVSKKGPLVGVTALKAIKGVSIIYGSEDEFDNAGIRRRAMELCGEADYVLFMAQDALPKNKYMTERLAEALNSEPDTNAVAYARHEPDKNTDILERCFSGFFYTDEPHSGLELAAETNNSTSALWCSNVCAMYSKRLYEEVGGFPLSAVANESGIFVGKALKADKDVVYVPSAVAVHSCNYTGAGYFGKYFDVGVSYADFDYIYRDYHINKRGLSMIRATAGYLIRRKAYFKIFSLIYYGACSFFGMELGRHYKMLPLKLVKKLSFNKGYWHKAD